MKSIAKGLMALNFLALIVTAAMAWALDRRTVPEWLDIANYVGLGMGALGALIFMGSSAGSSGSTGMAASAADQQDYECALDGSGRRHFDRRHACPWWPHVDRRRVAVGRFCRMNTSPNA